MTTEELKIRCVYLGKTVKEIAYEINERGIVRTSEGEINKLKTIRWEDMTPRFKRIWSEVDLVTAKWMVEYKRGVRERAAMILRRYDVIDDDYDEYDLDVVLCEESMVFVYDDRGRFVALVNLERGTVVMKNGKKEK